VTAPAKRVIVNADDLGRTAGINQGIASAHQNGIVTSATLMVNCLAARDVPALSAAHPKLGLGLHVALTGGKPALPPERLKTLVDAQGNLPGKPEMLEGASAREILAEARAQLLRFREIMGRLPTHLDSHHHAHRTAAVFEALVTLAWETGLPVRSAAPWMKERLQKEGIPTTDHFVEEFHEAGATRESLLRILKDAPAGTTEIMCRPAVVDDELRTSSAYADARTRELEVLTAAEVRQTLQALGITLVHFGQL
jgi:chitin disaccharide deacetylase